MLTDDIKNMIYDQNGINRVEVVWNGKSFPALFFARFSYVEASTGRVETRQPSIVCVTEDIREMENTDTILVDGTVYKVVSQQPDGVGMIRVILK